jgi:hypothetical protein
MAILSDLKHVLDNVNNGNDIDLPHRIKFQIGPIENEFERIEKQGRTWKIIDTFQNQYTISKLNNMVQDLICTCVLSKYDSRVKFKQNSVYTLF